MPSLNVPVGKHGNLLRRFGHCCGRRLSSRPSNFDLAWPRRRGEQQGRAVLRPITGPGMKFTGGSPPFAKLQTHYSANAMRVCRLTPQAHPQAGPALRVAPQFRRPPVLRDRQIRPPVTIKIRHRCAALFAIGNQSAFLAG